MFVARFPLTEVIMLPKHAARWITLVTAAALVAACQDVTPPVAPTAAAPSFGVSGDTQDRVARWFARAYPEVLALPGTVFADHDEVGARLVFGVENASAAGSVESTLERLGIPSSAYTVEVTEPIRPAITLRSRFRPTQAGIQIHFSLFVCTLGFNVSHSGGRSFVTNSHCTDHQGGTEGTEYAQPARSVDPTVIATEAADPEYFTWRENAACPVGRRCRYSDASRARYSDAVESSQGLIARTTGPNNGSLMVDDANPFFSITSQDNSTTSFKIRTVVNKVGRTTGWTQGEIVATCVHTNVFGSNFTQLCQTFVRNPNARIVAGGDSGSPVFETSGRDRAKLIGILWGGSGSSLYVFSPLKQIQDELGAFTATTK
jgi:hypothetical protein